MHLLVGHMLNRIRYKVALLFCLILLFSSAALCQLNPGLTASSAMNPSEYGGLVTLTASTVNGPTGTIIFSEGTTVLQTTSIPIQVFNCGPHHGICNSWTVTFSSTQLPLGNNTIAVSYSGDSNYTPAATNITQTIAGQAATPTVTVTSSQNPTVWNGLVVLSASVTGGATGTVIFTDSFFGVLGTPQLSGGVATLNAWWNTIGIDPITASYSGDGNNAPATSPTLQQQVLPSLALAAAPNPTTVNNPVVLTAEMPSDATGTMTFMDGTVVLGTSDLSAESGGLLSWAMAVATYTATETTAGSHSVVASYSGDSNYPPGLTNFVQLAVTQQLQVTTTALPYGTINTPYSGTLIVNGGVSPYSWSVIAGTLPAGLSLDPNSGNISGTPTTTGAYSFTVQVTDASSNTASQSLTITITSFAQPFITSLSPTTGAINIPVTILGGNFGNSQNGSTVTFNGAPAQSIINWTPTGIIAVVPSTASSGPVVVTVGGSSSNSFTFTVTGATITGLNPSAGGTGTPVTISGTGFGTSQGTNAITFNGIAASPTTWGDQTVITPVPAGASSGPVVITINGQPTNGQNFAVGANISSIAPTAGGPGTLVTVAGSGFGTSQGSSTVAFNGVPASPSSWSNTSISVPVPATATTGPVVVMVGRYASNGLTFAVSPSISNVLPTGGPVGTPITVRGLNFGLTQGTSSITFNGAAATPTNWGPNAIVAPVPAGASTGVIVVTAGGQSSNGVNFTVGAGSITGTVISAGNLSLVSGASVQVLQSNTLIASTSTASDGTYSVPSLTPGTYDVTVSAIGFGTGLSAGNAVSANQVTQVNFSLTLPGTIAGQITQQNGQPPISGANVTIFQGADAVAQASSDNNGNYTAPALAAGSYSVQASASGYNTQTQTNVSVTVGNTTPTNFSLTGQSAITYEYDDAGRLVGVVDSLNGGATYTYDPVGNILSISRISQGQVSIVGFSPTTGPVGTTVVISGAGFSPTPAQDTVAFNGVAANVVSATTTQLTVTVPTNATTGPISVTAPSGSYTTSNSFTVTTGTNGVAITSFAPLEGGAGSVVTIYGTGFDTTPSNDRVAFNGSPASVTSASQTMVSAVVPAQVTTGYISIATPAGSALSSLQFLTGQLQITNTTLPYGTINAPYYTTLTASGGVSPYSWSVINGTLPAGLSLNPNSGVISGTPTTSGTSNVTFQVTDAYSFTANKSLTISISTFTILDVPGQSNTAAYGINSSGTVVGSYYAGDGYEEAFIVVPPYGPSNYTLLALPSGGILGGYAPINPGLFINDSGTVAGSYIDSSGVQHGFTRDPSSGVITTFDAQPSGIYGTVVTGLNNLGEVVGMYKLTSSLLDYGFVRGVDGSITVFFDPSGGSDYDDGTYALGINDSGAITGYSAYNNYGGNAHGFMTLDAGTTFTDFDVLSGDTGGFSLGTDASQNPVIVGGDPIDEVTAGVFLRAGDGTVTTFDPSQGSGIQAVPTCIYDAGLQGNPMVTGWWLSNSTYNYYGFFRDALGNISSFQVTNTATITLPWALNASGTITGYFTDWGATHGFVGHP